MALERRYNKITDFLREEFDKIKIYEKDKKSKSNPYKQKKLVERTEKLLQKVDSMLKMALIVWTLQIR